MSAFKKTGGNLLNNGSDTCVVSFPAGRSGVQRWNDLIQNTNYCCVWTGRDNSDESEWFEPWKKNVEKANQYGMNLVFYINYGQRGGPGGRDHMGRGQRMEKKWLDEQGYRFVTKPVEDKRAPSGRFVSTKDVDSLAKSMASLSHK